MIAYSKVLLFITAWLFVSPFILADQCRSDNALFAKAFDEQKSDLQLFGRGKVVRILADDTKGSKHQRFIVELATLQTLLIAHNIDLAPRINHLMLGEQICFYGEYEWNRKGGVVHWTHHDPDGKHVGGWILHNGRKYQ